jgi:hypothetical protein
VDDSGGVPIRAAAILGCISGSHHREQEPSLEAAVGGGGVVAVSKLAPVPRNILLHSE